MRILQAAQKDLDAIVFLNKQLTLDGINCMWNASKWVSEEIENGSIHVLKDQKQVLGALCIHLHVPENTGEAWIETLAVHPCRHQRGYGSTLVNFAKQYASGDNKTLLTAGAFCAYNVRGFYLKCGFTPGPRVHFYNGIRPFYWFYMRLQDDC